ncbi:MAG TPA: c-type cytochrome [Candidatus Acidoferrales bacterium]|nr:c-type cytochrome [Candidatus Acidoferrales bacterium]
MFRLRVIAMGAVAAWGAWAADIVPGDARRGEQLFQSEHCIQCHSIKGRGGSLAPDLARRIDRDYTPAVMASLMWNHAPDMWDAMKKNGVNKTSLSPEAASDLFAYFVSARYFERPGDAARGKQAFAARHCTDCHGITSSPVAAAPPVAKWESLAEPVVLAQQMWNHGAKMREQFSQKKLAWSKLTAQELTDMLVYLQNLPETRNLASNFSFPPSDTGEKLFVSKGCAGCHTGPKMALENRLHNQTLTEIAVDMWNHQPSMKNPPPELSQEEMRQIISYIWARQYFRGSGSAERGKKVFSDAHCASCHDDPSSGAPKLGKGKDAYSDITMVAALWNHGPRMLEGMNQRKLAWPRFTAQQMSDLIAYLNSL